MVLVHLFYFIWAQPFPLHLEAKVMTSFEKGSMEGKMASLRVEVKEFGS